MTTTKRSGANDFDWYLISIDRLKQIGLVVLIVLLAGAAYWFYQKEKGNPRSNAASAISDARQSLNALASSKNFAQHRNEFDRAQQKLDEANTLFAAAKFQQAQGAAVESQTVSRAALSGGAEPENAAQFLTVEGDVRFQKGSSGDWRSADPRLPLYNGDWVKTGDKASAELLFANGSVYTVGPNALLEIFTAINPITSKKTNSVQMQVGSVEVATSNETSAVHTPGSQIVIDSDSATQVGVDPTKATSVVSTKGSSSIVSNAGGAPVQLATGEKVSASPEGTLSDVKKLQLPPALTTPGDNQVFQIAPDSRVEFAWSRQPAAAAYMLQVSRSRLFSTLEINSRRTAVTASARVSAEGAFYWRVASIGTDGEIGPFSPFRKFRVSGGKVTASGSADTVPPVLEVKKPYSIGGPFFMIEGKTEPGASVFINDEEVDVEADGHFKKLVSFNKVGPNSVVVKAVDPAGNQAVKSETVLVEE